MSSVTELRLNLAELEQISISCTKCCTRILLDLLDTAASVPEQCPSCGEEYDEEFRAQLRAFRDAYRRILRHHEGRIEVRVCSR